MKTILTVLLLSGLLSFPLEKKSKTTLKQPANIIRTCCAFGYDLSVARIPFLKKSDITDGKDLGNHQYLGNPTENNGIVYTKHGGFIDIGHLRDYADWTFFLYEMLKNAEGPSELALGKEAGSKSLNILIDPRNTEVDLYQLAGSMAYDISKWHEIATWFGSSYLPLVPEAYSSFSPEDLYSNRLGIEIGIEALKSPKDFDTAVSEILRKWMERLEVVSSEAETYTAMEDVHNQWWTREKALPNKRILLKRHFGDDTKLTPWLTSLYPDAKPLSLEKFDAKLDDYYELKIEISSKIRISDFEGVDQEYVSQRDFDRLTAIIKLQDDILQRKIQERHDSKQVRLDKRATRQGSTLGV